MLSKVNLPDIISLCDMYDCMNWSENVVPLKLSLLASFGPFGQNHFQSLLPLINRNVC